MRAFFVHIQEGAFHIDSGHIGPRSFIRLLLFGKASHSMENPPQLFFVDGHGSRAIRSNAMSILISKNFLQPLHIAVRKIMSHRTVTVDINQTRQNQQPFRIHFRFVRYLIRTLYNFAVLYI